MPAHATANSVIASAKRLIDVRHFWWRSRRIAEMSVPAWPIPIHQTKLTMAKPHATGTLMPQMPTPLMNSHVTAIRKIVRTPRAIAEADQPAHRRAARQDDRADLVGDRPEGVTRRDDRRIGRGEVPLRVRRMLG